MQHIPHSIVLLSGGLDSAVNLAMAKEYTKVKLCVTFDYLQCAREKEIEASSALCKYYGVEHKIIRLQWFKELAPSALTGESCSIPSFDKEKAKEGAEAVWVPCRNAVFLMISAAIAESIGAELIVTGFNAEEGEFFPDNSPEFIEAANKLLKYATLKDIKVVSYTISMKKPQIVKEGERFSVPFSLIWSCYKGEEKMCGVCQSCIRCKEAFKEAGCIHKIEERFYGV